ncbi:MAG: glutamine-hydrolyzing carbamoyl-phosphate synthase small subunit, partial [Flavobacteriales bacterium]|nr:glutamine-hydrolyzing carbamoyl-phosphate synthase small subunit [Flavobacteriales bacterium]
MKFQDKKDAVLLLQDGTMFWGKSIGAQGTAQGELCFNTGMTGYQEIFTDPSYFGQIMVTTNAHIGNYGVNADEVESEGMKIAGLVCRNFNFSPSRVASDGSLENYFKNQNKLAICDVDTRAVVSYIRNKGAMNAVISTHTDDIDALKKILADVPDMKGLELASSVSTKEPYFVGDENAPIKIAAVDLGIKKNILRNLTQRGCYVKVFPYNVTLEQMKEWNPDGYFLSNGPGDPEPLTSVQALAREIIAENLPLFGICLGHQIIALSQGISTYKMHNGHRGINHPIMNLETGRGEITSQNHGFVVNREQAEKADN